MTPRGGGQATTTTVTLPTLSILNTCETNLVEEDTRPLACTAHTVQIALPEA